MKKLFLFLVAVFTFIGCGDDVTNINGYTDEQVQAKIDSTLDAQNVVVMNDTVYQHTVDTIYDMVIDTVTHELVDTIYQRVVDTIYKDLVDTLYQRVVDTVYNELVDTIYTRVVDTVFTELERVGVDISKPRDTTITLYDTTDGIVISRTFSGIVYKNTFYEHAEYRYLFNDKRDEGKSYSAKVEYYRVPNTSFSVPDYSYENNCSGNSKYACGIEGTVYYVDECGTVSKPDYHNVAYRSKTSIKKVGNWRLFNAKDAANMSQYLDMIVSDTTQIYLSTVQYDTAANGDFIANVAMHHVVSMTSANRDKLNIKYVCAYDLN